MLYVGHGHVVEAVGDGVRKVLLQQAISDATLAVALRRANLSPNSAAAVISFVEDQKGRAYDTRGLSGKRDTKAISGSFVVFWNWRTVKPMQLFSTSGWRMRMHSFVPSWLPRPLNMWACPWRTRNPRPSARRH